MRVQNSLKNIIFGLSGQIITFLTAFIVRTVFISTLGIEYLGIDGLFTNILTILSLANLGFDTAIVFSLYKPLAENDKTKIVGLMNLYAKAYRLIGAIVLLIGLSLLPFLPHLINGKTNIDNINTIYLLFLINSVSSYFLAYKQSIIIADQRNYIISKIYTVFTIVSNLLQIILLVYTKNYLIVLSVQITLRIVQNIYILNKANRLYPYLKEMNKVELSYSDKRTFFQNLLPLVMYRISGVVINGTDNIVISKFVGLAWVGICSNYLLIISTLNAFLSQIFYSITASVGNLNVKESADKKLSIFRIIYFTNFWLYGFCSVCLWNLFNPFITLWLGKQYVMNELIVFAIVLNFYTTGMQNAATTFRETTGLFKIGKYIPIIAAILNLIISIMLVQVIGVAGVFFGTVLSRLCTYFWYDPRIIFKNIFHKPVMTYFLKYVYFGVIVFVSAVIVDISGSMVHVEVFTELIIRGILCIVIPNAIFFILFRTSDEFNYVWDVIKRFIFRIN